MLNIGILFFIWNIRNSKKIFNTLKSVLLKNVQIDIIANDITTTSVLTLHCTEDELLRLIGRSVINTISGFTKN